MYLMNCPKCHSELKPETNFCAQCGSPRVIPSQKLEDERAAQHDAPGDEAAGPNRTRQIGSKDLSFQAPATPVERIPNQEAGAPESGTAPPEADSVRAAGKARSPRPALRTWAAVVALGVMFSVIASVCTTLVLSRFLVQRAEPQQAQQPQPAPAPLPEPTVANRLPEQAPAAPREEVKASPAHDSSLAGEAPAVTPAPSVVDENARLARELEEKRKELNDLKRQLADVNGMLAVAQGKLDQTRVGLARGKRELAETRKNVKEVRKEFAQAESLLASLKNEVAGRQRKLNQLEARIGRGRREDRQLKTTIASRKGEIKLLNAQVMRVEQAARRLRRDLDSRTFAGR
jgi:hypothetical protein